MICVCVKANIWFTYQKEYEINFDDASGDITVKSDDYGCCWYADCKGDGCYVCVDSRGEEAVFLEKAKAV